MKTLARNDSKIMKCVREKKSAGYFSLENCLEEDEEKFEFESFFRYEKIYDSFGSFLNANEIFEHRLNEVGNFISINKRKPKTVSKNKFEKNLACWLSRQRINFRKKLYLFKKENIYNLMNSFLEENRNYLKTHDDIWLENYNFLLDFIENNKKTPSSESKIPFEKKLGLWLSSHKKIYNDNKVSNKQRYNLLYNLFNEKKEYFKTIDEIWYEHLNELKIFISEKNKLPVDSSKDPYEKKLGGWLSHQKENYKKKHQKMNEEVFYNIFTDLINKYSELFKTKNELWEGNYFLLCKFIDKNNKLPVQRSIDCEEKKLNKWLQHQNEEYKDNKHGMKCEERYNKWTNFLNTYSVFFKNNDQIWFEHMKGVKEFINKNNKLPTYGKNKAETENILGRWLSNQKRNFIDINFSEKHQVRHEEFNNFCKEYSKYF